MTYEFIVFERRGGIAWVTMKRPDRRNALTPDMREEMIDTIGVVAGDLDLRCMVKMVFFAEPWGAADAERIGLVNKVVPGEELETAVMEWAERLAAGPTKALGLAKRLLNRSLESDLATSLAEEALTQELINQTDDIKEGMISFAERRDPKFTGT